MSLILTAADTRALGAAAEALLSPDAATRPEAWRQTVEERLRLLLPGANVLLVTPEADRLRYASDSVAPDAIARLTELTAADPQTGRMRARDPIIEEWFHLRRARRLEVWNEALNDGMLDRRLHRSVVYNEGLLPGGLYDFSGLATECASGELILMTGYDRRGRSRRGAEADLALLGLLLPAFRAGHRALAAGAAALPAPVDVGAAFGTPPGTPARRPSAATAFAELADLGPAARDGRLAALAAHAPTLAGEVRALLDADAAAGDFLGLQESPAPGRRAPAAVSPAGAPPEDDGPDGVRPDARVGPYRLERPLGAGGMAAVWLAHDERLGRPVALKFPHDAPAGGLRAGACARFLTEARAAAALDHPHVAPVYDVGETADGRLYIAMGYCAGGSLADRLAAGPLPPREAARVGGQLARALAAAHARGVVHRDVKPPNVLFDASGAVRLADFGVAKLAGRDATRPGVVLGTVAYVAPEVLCGEPADPRADLWALGVTLYEALAGRRPFAAESHAAVMHLVVTGEPPALRDLAPATPPALAALVHALLAKHPGVRPDATAAGRMLDALAAGGAPLRAPTPALAA